MNVQEINAFIFSIEKVFSENIKLSIKRNNLSPYSPVDISRYSLMINIKVISKGIDRIVYYFPELTAKNISCEMFFGLDITDKTLIHSAIVELFYRITTTATNFKKDILINTPPEIKNISKMGDEDKLYGITIDFSSRFGPFIMSVLDIK